MQLDEMQLDEMQLDEMQLDEMQSLTDRIEDDPCIYV
jgi:hypothetical protein